MAALAPCLTAPPDALAPLQDAPEAGARLGLALDGLDPPEAGAERAVVRALARAMAPGGLVIAALAGRMALVDGSGGSERLLRWLRGGLEMVAEAAPGRRALRSQAHLRAVWGGAFEILRVSEGAMSGFRDVVVLRRRAGGAPAGAAAGGRQAVSRLPPLAEEARGLHRLKTVSMTLLTPVSHAGMCTPKTAARREVSSLASAGRTARVG